MNAVRFRREERLAAVQIGVALAALFIGTWFGPLQAYEHAGLNLYDKLAPGIRSYYQGLTLHAVLNALVWTTFFITGFFTFAIPHSLKRALDKVWLNVTGVVLMIVGLVMAAIPILLNKATVLYTFYPPLKADPFYYIGLTLVVVGSWVVGYSFYFTVAAWRRENPGQRVPFVAFASTLTMVLWQIATLGVAAEMLGMLIPWSLGLLKGADPLLARTLFWFTGHPLVYFWLLPAYVSWYGMVPKQAGGKLFSDSLARLAFWLFLILSTPVGFHHQYTDPGLPQGWKFLHAFLTFGVFFPSMLTAFTVVASLEVAGRARGGTGLLGWIRKLPWGDPSVTAQILAMLVFAFGGISGLTNASYNLNLATHNTTWVPGHFHMTVATGVTLSFMGILYWLLPRLTGRRLFSRKAALAQAWLWFIGMILFANGLHLLGLRYGAPRRTMLGSAPYFQPEWRPFLLEAAVGATLLWISYFLFFGNVLATLFAGAKLEEPVEMPEAEPLDNPQAQPEWLHRWTPWVVGAFVLIVISYGPMLYILLRNLQLFQPAIPRFW